MLPGDLNYDYCSFCRPQHMAQRDQEMAAAADSAKAQCQARGRHFAPQAMLRPLTYCACCGEDLAGVPSDLREAPLAEVAAARKPVAPSTYAADLAAWKVATGRDEFGCLPQFS